MGIKFLQCNAAVLVFITLVCSFNECSCGNGKVSCIEKERQALFAFKQSLANSITLSSWTGQDCCSWNGVLCNNVTGHIMELDLSYKGLIGSEVSASFVELKHLEFLDLSSNKFSSIKIPSFFGNFKSLTTLDLSYSSFAGVVPPSLGNLSNLQELDLDGLELLEIDNLNWLSQLSTLHTLDLSLTDLSHVPDISRVFSSFPLMSSLSLKGCGLNEIHLSSLSCTNLTNLEWLDLSTNNYSGQLPDWLTQLPSIERLDLSSNFFSGLIPSSFFPKSSTLRYLYLSYNQLNGTIPKSIGQLSNLEELFLDSNILSGIISEIHFNKLVHLEWLSLGYNILTINMSTDWVPPFQLRYFHLESCKFENGFPLWLQTQKFLQHMDLGNAEISGSYHFEDIVPLLPSSIKSLVLSNCSISGFIPPNIANVFPNLHSVILSHNSISGSIPVSFCELINLVVLDLADNHLHGDLPRSCWSDSLSLSVLDLSSNNLTGLIPSSVRNWSRLRSLHLKNNHFFGELPMPMESCLSMEILDLANNKFSRNLPAWVKRLKYLRILNLRSNKFNGSLVHELCAISTLQIIDLADNNFVGTIPSCFRNFSGMILGGNTESFYGVVLGYFDSLNQVIKGRELEYQKILKFLVNLDLSSNNLVGHIPEELTLLSGLHNFNLSHNQLTGSISKKIGYLQNLESLDFSHNHLTGIIPQSISELTSLARLNLSYNNLSGKIPIGNQLQTLVDPSIYEGNHDLCGIQIEKECAEDDSFQFIGDDEKANEESEMLGFYIGLMVGVVVGFWGVLGILAFKRTWCYAYFRIIENVYEMLVAKIMVCMSLLKKN